MFYNNTHYVKNDKNFQKDWKHKYFFYPACPRHFCIIQNWIYVKAFSNFYKLTTLKNKLITKNPKYRSLINVH